MAKVIMGAGMSSYEPQTGQKLRSKTPPNGNSRRLHKENVKRKRLRRITKKSKQTNCK